MNGSLLQKIRGTAAVLAITALLALPAAVSTAQPADADNRPSVDVWSFVWDHLSTVVTVWFGAPTPDGVEHVNGEADTGNLGSTLDPDGLTTVDPPPPPPFKDSSSNELGSTLDPDGDA